jgi:hypothetical protein
MIKGKIVLLSGIVIAMLIANTGMALAGIVEPVTTIYEQNLENGEKAIFEFKLHSDVDKTIEVTATWKKVREYGSEYNETEYNETINWRAAIENILVDPANGTKLEVDLKACEPKIIKLRVWSINFLYPDDFAEIEVSDSVTKILTKTTISTQIYKGEGTLGGLVPDFTQESIANKSAICAAAAAANSLWYFDQHGYSNLVLQTDENKPNDNWVNDSKKLTLELAYLIYGKDYVDCKTNKSRWTDPAKVVEEYAKNHGHPELTAKNFWGSNASHDKWMSELKRCEDVIAIVSWHYANETQIGIGHDMTGVGYDINGEKLKVVHGWGNHSNATKPYNKSFFNEYNITHTTSNQIKIPKSTNNNSDVFKGRFDKADYILVDGFYSVSPLSNKSSRVEDERIQTEDPNIDEYQYTVFNRGDDLIYQFALEVKVPFYNVHAPIGWSWQPWDPALTPDITPGPTFSQPPGEQPIEFLWEPAWNGIIWYTETNPVLPDEAKSTGFSGFSYQVDSTWEHSETASFSGLSNGISEYFGATPSGLTTEFYLVSGPCSPPKVESSDSAGNKKDIFRQSDSVYAFGCNYPDMPSSPYQPPYDLYVVYDRQWTDGDGIPARVSGTSLLVNTANGCIAPHPTLIWDSSNQGKYDIVVDVNGNGKYDKCIDALDDLDIGDAGFVVPVPTLTLIGMIALIGLLSMVAMNRIKRL